MQDHKAVPRQNQPRFKELRARYPNSYKPWSEAEDDELKAELAQGVPVEEIASLHKRKLSAVRSHIAHLEL